MEPTAGSPPETREQMVPTASVPAGVATYNGRLPANKMATRASGRTMEIDGKNKANNFFRALPTVYGITRCVLFMICLGQYPRAYYALKPTGRSRASWIVSNLPWTCPWVLPRSLLLKTKNQMALCTVTTISSPYGGIPTDTYTYIRDAEERRVYKGKSLVNTRKILGYLMIDAYPSLKGKAHDSFAQYTA
ncbi:hypothetical protein EVAR_48647_1 [Eumeta japonica]|uniref:Uncharacterized protein n=1 Tax=Eumeta variegata TaxID=151549 RepID=A0A4C1XPT7_EUMVA|nr:hypothetical protein EVAR_48647_1 [Eumeta japonica]